jgi:hypothetical protein
MNDTPLEPERDADVLRLFQQPGATPDEREFVHEVARELRYRRRRNFFLAAAAAGLLLLVALRLKPAGDALLAAADQLVVQKDTPVGWGLAAFIVITVLVASVVSVVTRAQSES